MEYLQSIKPQADLALAVHLSQSPEGDDRDTARKIVDRLSDGPQVTYRTRYNLACYYSIVGERESGSQQQDHFKAALFHLEYALQRRGTIVEWARVDPSLHGVRTQMKTDFVKILTDNSPDPPESKTPAPSSAIWWLAVAASNSDA